MSGGEEASPERCSAIYQDFLTKFSLPRADSGALNDIGRFMHTYGKIVHDAAIAAADPIFPYDEGVAELLERIVDLEDDDVSKQLQVRIEESTSIEGLLALANTMTNKVNIQPASVAKILGIMLEAKIQAELVHTDRHVMINGLLGPVAAEFLNEERGNNLRRALWASLLLCFVHTVVNWSLPDAAIRASTVAAVSATTVLDPPDMGLLVSSINNLVQEVSALSARLSQLEDTSPQHMSRARNTLDLEDEAMLDGARFSAAEQREFLNFGARRITSGEVNYNHEFNIIWTGKLQTAYKSSKETFTDRVHDVSVDELVRMVYSEDGLFLVGTSGIPHQYKLDATKKPTVVNLKVTCALYNPDGAAPLSQLGVQKHSPHLFPVSYGQFKKFIDQEFDTLALGRTCLSLPEVPPIDRMKNLGALRSYRTLCSHLFRSLFGEDSEASVASHNEHVTRWLTFLRFHINRWMKAMFSGDLEILTHRFDEHWDAHYSPSLRPGSSGTPPIQLADALAVLDYKCPRCNRRGACILWCPNDKCNTTQSIKSPTPSKAYFDLKKQWKKDHSLQNSKATIAAFEKSELFINSGLASAKDSSNSEGSTGLTCQSVFHRQNEIAPHTCIDSL